MRIVEPQVTEYIEGFGGIKDFLELEEYAKEQYIPIVMKDAARFLGFMVATLKPQKVLELGTAIGYSALIMATHGAKEIISVERDERMRDMALQNIQNHGQEKRIKVVHDDCLHYLQTSEEQVDFVFMDAGKSHYREYLDLCLPKLNPGGVILCDNVLYRGLVSLEKTERKHRTNIVNLQEFIRYVHEREDLLVSLLSISDGMLLIRRKEEHV